MEKSPEELRRRGISLNLNHRKKFVFVHIPKTAGTSLRPFLLLPGSTHNPASWYSNIDYPKISFVRNPYDRLASLWSYYRHNRVQAAHKINQKTLYRFSKFSKFCEHLHEIKILTIEETIEQFDKPDGQSLSYNFQPQTYWLDDHMSFVGRFENLERGCLYLAKKFNLPIKALKHKNRSHRKPTKEMYNKNTCEIVNEIYKSDFEDLGYEMSLL